MKIFIDSANLQEIEEALPQMASHPKTDEAVHQFLTDFKAWLR